LRGNADGIRVLVRAGWNVDHIDYIFHSTSCECVRAILESPQPPIIEDPATGARLLDIAITKDMVECARFAIITPGAVLRARSIAGVKNDAILRMIVDALPRERPREIKATLALTLDNAFLRDRVAIVHILLEAGVPVRRFHFLVGKSLAMMQLVAAHLPVHTRRGCGGRFVSQVPADAQAWAVATEAWTPLHFVEFISPARVLKLIEGGADPFASEPDTPASIARAVLGRIPEHAGAQLLLQAVGGWTSRAHHLFPAPARARAIELLLLGSRMPMPTDVWVSEVMPRAIDRDSVGVRCSGRLRDRARALRAKRV
jgi:hypothetical protein